MPPTLEGETGTALADDKDEGGGEVGKRFGDVTLPAPSWRLAACRNLIRRCSCVSAMQCSVMVECT